MKVTADIPADLAQRLKEKAAEQGVDLSDLIVEACRSFVDPSRKPKRPKAKKFPFPIFKGGHPAKPGEELTPEKVSEILWGSGE